MDTQTTDFYKQLFDLAFEPVIVRRLDGAITEWNRGAAELYGYRRHEAVGVVSHTLLKTVFPVSQAELEDRLDRDGYWIGELIHTTRDGRQVTVESRQQLFSEPHGNRVVLETNRDISAYKARYRMLFEGMQEGMAYCRMIYDAQGQAADWLYLDANPALERLLGVPGLAGKRASELFPGLRETSPDLFAIYGRVARTGQPETYENHLPALNMWVRVSAFSPEPDYIVVIGEDITQRKHTELALRESEARFRLALQDSPIVVFAQDRELRYTWIYNPAPDFHAENVLGKTDAELLPADDAARLAEIKHRVMASGIAVREDVVMHIGDQAFYYELYVEPRRSESGQITGVYAVSIEITARKQAEAALRESEARLRLALDGAEMGTWDWDLTSDHIVWNQRQFVLFGIAPEGFTGHGAEAVERVHPQDRERIKNAIKHAVEQHSPFNEEFRVVHNDGRVRWLVGRGLTLPPAVDGSRRMIGVNYDITARKEEELVREHRHEEQLARLYRIGTVNELAGGLAHELSQPLTAIQNYAGGCLKWVDSGGDPGQIRHALEAINTQSHRVVDIIQHLRRLMVTGEPQCAPTDLNEVLMRARDLLKVPLARKNVRVTVELARDLPKVNVDALQIEQVVIILLRNCIDAFAGEYLAHAAIELRTAMHPDGAVDIVVTDNGPGVAPEVLQQMFEPFYTTKEKGLGLGLMLARSIVRAHNGSIRARPRSGGGLTIHITLPVDGTGHG